MKRSITSYKSYCQLLRLWSGHTARLVPPTYSCCSKNAGRLTSACHRSRAPSIRAFCTKAEDIDAEEVDDDEDIIEDTGPTIPVNQHRTNLPAKFRTQHDDPTKHTVGDVGMFYKVSNEDYEKYIQNGQWPDYKKQVKTFQESVMMVRQPALEVFGIIDNANYDYPPLRLLFYGKIGCGKSMSLSHVVHRCAKQGMITIHLPNIADMIRHIPTVERPHAMSDYTEGQYDLIDDAVNWLIHFKSQNEELLKKNSIKTTKEYTWSLRESASTGTDLLDIIAFGIERKRYASDCIGVLFKEIKMAASEKRVKVLVAIRGVNGLWKNTNIKNIERKLVNAQEVSTFQHFRGLLEPTWRNGICIGTLCPSVEALDNKIYNKKTEVPYTPQYLLKKEGFEFMDPFVPVLVPEYNHKEAHNCIDYFIERKWIIKPRGLTEAGKKELMMISNMNPLQLMTLSGLF